MATRLTVKQLIFIAAFSVWTYGSEALDTLVAESEYREFMTLLECRVVNETTVECKVGREWVRNEPRA